jgi:Fe-S-cluster-containing dehydrogenase component/DMSO reductase anchor subunit
VSLLSAVEPVDDDPLGHAMAARAQATAVDRFSQRHDAGTLPDTTAYRDLIPGAPPGPGQQYAFEVDLDACTGCKACVTGCHSLNGLDEGEVWRSVTLLRGASPQIPVQQTVTAACHHCLDAACLRGCPVDAYEKDPVTGIVRHLDDQCIGCSYCTLTCPYEVPAYRPERGIVRKCDMCAGRLAAGEAPACVQACPNEAISITTVDVEAIRPSTATGALVPGVAPSAITRPTTRYRTERPERLEAVASETSAEPAHGHPPLAAMLVLTQVSVGAFVAGVIRRGGQFGAAFAALTGVVALAASVLHLGRPRYSYRAIIGFRHSWLSREVVAFGGFTGMACVYALLRAIGFSPNSRLLAAVAVTAGLTGIAGIACSVLLYVVTRRSSWRPLATTARFGSTAVVGGALTFVATQVVVGAMRRGATSVGRDLPLLVATLAMTELLVEGLVFAGRRAETARRASLLRGPLARATRLRFAAGWLGGVGGPVLLATVVPVGRPSWLAAVLAPVALLLYVTGELAERSLFFTTASRPR